VVGQRMGLLLRIVKCDEDAAIKENALSVADGSIQIGDRHSQGSLSHSARISSNSAIVSSCVPYMWPSFPLK